MTISLADVTDHDIKLTDKKLTFTGKSQGKDWTAELTFFKDVEPEGSIWNVLPSSIQMKLNKKVEGEEFWPRLLADKHLEKSFVKVSVSCFFK